MFEILTEASKWHRPQSNAGATTNCCRVASPTGGLKYPLWLDPFETNIHVVARAHVVIATEQPKSPSIYLTRHRLRFTARRYAYRTTLIYDQINSVRPTTTLLHIYHIPPPKHA